MADSQMLRWIDEINRNNDCDEKAFVIRKEIKNIKKAPASIDGKRQMRNLYSELDKIQFKPDYMSLIIDKKKDYYRACKGFQINGIKYIRLLGTTGGIKNSTIVFVSERVFPELHKRIDAGRDLDKELVPAKFEAYRALTCSGSRSVSMPRGIVVVNDCITRFTSDIIELTEQKNGEPLMTPQKDAAIELNCCDGCGMMCPALAERWSDELDLGYISCGFNTRFSWEKGMTLTLDFHEFARDVAKTDILIDAWGNEVNINDVELVLTTSMVKLWDSYSSCEEYLNACMENGYTFNIAKTCPERLENERSLNYQFIQSYELSDDDIDELIGPTIQEFHEVLGGDIMKTILFMCGRHLDEHSFEQVSETAIRALFVDQDIWNDPNIKRRVFNSLRQRINDAKVGVIKVRGNYSVVSGDLFALAQSMFGLPVTGLLQAGEIYSDYWLKSGVRDVACFRAPMSCHSNIRKMAVTDKHDALYWFRYMNTCTILNAWDTTYPASNGMDNDGDIILTTNNRVLLDNLKELPALMCAQNKAPKTIPTEANIVESNINGFGDDIGKITNRVTSMYTIRSKYSQDSEEYKTLTYRISCGQLFQQNCIDKAKGIEFHPMPRNWYDRLALCEIPEDKRDLHFNIVAEKKPYFMTYIYPELKHHYSDYTECAGRQCRQQFKILLDELLSLPKDRLTAEQFEWIRYYYIGLPVRSESCVMNRICRKFEQEFDTFLKTVKESGTYCYSSLTPDVTYSARQYYVIKKLFDDYTQKIASVAKDNLQIKSDSYGRTVQYQMINDYFNEWCCKECPNSQTLLAIILDLMSKDKKTSKFLWDVVGEEIIETLLNKNGGSIRYPVLDPEGTIEYCGEKYSVHTQQILEESTHSSNIE